MGRVVAVVMDLLTDLQILQDLLDAAQRRGVAVYIILEARGMPHFLDMCTRLQITALHLRNLRVRTVKGSGLALSFGRLPGSLCSKYMLVDGEKVMFGSYSFTWSSSRMDRNTITVMSGQVVDFFDNDFREMYAVSENVDLYKEFHISKPPMPAPVRKVVEVPKPLLVSTSRFQVSLGDSRGQADQRVPAHKYHNPKYSLVVGNSLGLTGSLQDLSTRRDSLGSGLEQNGLSTLLHAKGGSSVELNKVTAKSPSFPVEEEEGKGGLKKLQAFGGKKQRSSFRLFLKGRGSNHNISETNSTATEDSFEIVEKPSLLKFKNKKPSKLPQRSMSLMTLNKGEDDGKGHKKPSKKNCIQS
ncbi:hypothetical protein J4Q44_G00391460 [Coregonus suidteri]|uniref:Scaffolding anchor of CK1 domain-containing protein n=1 Tax=Coregonus suidteri TaxID=861788 RepID=A0AAN8KH16_9TELE